MHPARYVRSYLDHLRGLQRREATIEEYAALLRRFEAFATDRGVREWKRVTPALLLEYQVHVAGALNSRGVSFAPAVRNLHLIVLRGLFRHLEATGDLPANPSRGIDLAREPERLPRTVPTEREMRRFLRMVRTTNVLELRDRAVLEVLYSSGIRRKEAVGLDLADVDFDDGVLTVRQGKGGRDRVVPMGRVAAGHLERYLRRGRPLLAKVGADPGRVFLSATGRPLDGRAVGYLVQRAVRKTGFKCHLTPHVFRHAFATHMIRNRANVRHVQEMLGHAKLETTERYLHLTILDLKDAHRRFHPRERER